MTLQIVERLRLAVPVEIAGAGIDVGVEGHQPALDQVRLCGAMHADGDVGLTHAEIEIAVGDQQRDTDFRVSVEELPKMGGEPNRAHADRGVHPKMTCRGVAALAQCRLRPRHPLGDIEGSLEENLALLGEHEASGVAMEKGCREVFLERPNLAADG
jgi:hypothetical protein